MPQHQRELGLSVRQSNLCSEILLHSGKDHLGNERTAVCCLSSLNVEKFLEWRDHPTFIEDAMRFLDNVLQDFIDRAPPAMANAAYAAYRERSVGLGIMGFHSLLQDQNVPFESAMAKSWNMRIFKHLRRGCDAASRVLAAERGPCPDAAERGVMERFSHKIAIAPTAVDLDHLRRHQRRHRADPGQHLYAQDPLRLVRGQEPLPGTAAGGARQEHAGDLGARSWRRGLGAAPRTA